MSYPIRLQRAFAALPIAAAAIVAYPAAAPAQQTTMSFFVTSVGLGKGGDLGGIEGADRHCQALAQAAGAGNRTWHAYLSATAAANSPAVNARDRIGAGPWRNVKGEQIAASVADLHSDNNKISKETALTEKGTVVNGVGDSPNQHDVLTGSQPDGTAFAAGEDRTCSNWTSSSDTQGRAMVGHTDRRNPQGTEPGRSWNSSHLTRSCSQEGLRVVGGAGFLYCFAAN